MTTGRRYSQRKYRQRRANLQPNPRMAFSMVEIIVVMAVLAMLAAVLLPSLSGARDRAKMMACRSNMRQILLANGYYTGDSNGVYCPGASKFLTNLNRWHGGRDHPTEAFDPSSGPLAIYLGPDGQIKECPSFPSKQIAATSGGFEQSNGGYGYNNAFIGMQVSEIGSGAFVVDSDLAGAYADQVGRPAKTVMFTDAALAENSLIEYSFAEPRFHPQYQGYRPEPSIHFRHRGEANVAWCDGHVDAHERTFTYQSGLYTADADKLGIGWFGKSDDNSLFDLE